MTCFFNLICSSPHYLFVLGYDSAFFCYPYFEKNQFCFFSMKYYLFCFVIYRIFLQYKKPEDEDGFLMLKLTLNQKWCGYPISKVKKVPVRMYVLSS